MQHRVNDFFHREELSFIAGIAQAKTDLLTLVPVQAQEVLLGGPEFGQDANFPSSLSHNGLHERSDLP